MAGRSARRQSNRQSRSQSRSQRQSKRQTRKQRYGKTKVKRTKGKRNNRRQRGGSCGCAAKAPLAQNGGYWGGRVSETSYTRKSKKNHEGGGFKGSAAAFLNTRSKQTGGGWGASSTTYVRNQFGNQVGGGSWGTAKALKKSKKGLPFSTERFFTKYF